PAPIRALAWSSAGKALRRMHRFAAAAESFENALGQYEYAEPERLERDIPLGPSQRADVFYESARLAAVDENKPREAVDLLSRLDHLGADESWVASMPPAERKRFLARWQEAGAQLQAPGPRHAGKLERSEETFRERPCLPAGPPVPVARGEVKAVPLED